MDNSKTRRRFLTSAGLLALAGCVQTTNQGQETQNGDQADSDGGSGDGSNSGNGGSGGNSNTADGDQNETQTQNETANETADVEEEVDYVSEPRRDRRVSVVRDSVRIKGKTIWGEVENTGNVPLMGSDIEVLGNMLDNDGIEIARGETNPKDVYFEPGETLPFKFSISVEVKSAKSEVNDRMSSAQRLAEFGQRFADFLHLEADVLPRSELEIPIPRKHYGAKNLSLLDGKLVEVTTSVTEGGNVIPDTRQRKATFDLRLNNLSERKVENFGVVITLRKEGSTPQLVDFKFVNASLEPEDRGENRVVKEISLDQRNLNVRDPEIRITLYENTEIVAADAE
ncbi:MAG: hypothetical protein SV253_00650 [Halobacteria archaeon]|nr:hypothetical protein [Halobacteria archaeon]